MVDSCTLTFVDAAAIPASIRLERGRVLPPTSVGTHGMWRVDAPGMRDVHIFLYFDGETLFAQSADSRDPATIAGHPVGTDWIPIAMPCEIAFGGVCLQGAWSGHDASMSDAIELASAESWQAPRSWSPVGEDAVTRDEPVETTSRYLSDVGLSDRLALEPQQPLPKRISRTSVTALVTRGARRLRGMRAWVLSRQGARRAFFAGLGILIGLVGVWAFVGLGPTKPPADLATDDTPPIAASVNNTTTRVLKPPSMPLEGHREGSGVRPAEPVSVKALTALTGRQATSDTDASAGNASLADAGADARVAGDGKTAERRAVDAFAAGDLELALVLYTQLAQSEPRRAEYAEARRVIGRRLAALGKGKAGP